MKSEFTAIVMLTVVLVRGINATSYASLHPSNLKFCFGLQEPRRLKRRLYCKIDKKDFPGNPPKVFLIGYMGTEPIGQQLVGSHTVSFEKHFDIYGISQNNSSPINFLCVARHGIEWVKASVDVPLVYPPEEPPYLMIDGRIIHDPETTIPHDGTLTCSVSGGLPSTNLTLNCSGHRSVSGNTSVQMRVKEAVNKTKCTCRGVHPSDCYEKHTTEVTLIVSQVKDVVTSPKPDDTAQIMYTNGSTGLQTEIGFNQQGCAGDNARCAESLTCLGNTCTCLATQYHDGSRCQTGCTPQLCGKHNCQTFDDVTSCSCLSGYENSSPLHCEDIDECKQPDICYNHSCINKNGTYACRCQSGFKSIAPQTCVKDDVIAFQTSVQEEKSEIFLFNLRSITPHKVVACGLSSLAIGFLILAGIQCAMTIVNATATFATTKPMKGLHSRMLKKHYIDITYNEEEDSDINSDDTSEETKDSDKEDKELSSSTSSTSMSYSSSTSTKPTSYNTSKSPTPKSYNSSRQSSE